MVLHVLGHSNMWDVAIQNGCHQVAIKGFERFIIEIILIGNLKPTE
jgi:hypothetical protein